MRALVSCPTGSIRIEKEPKSEEAKLWTNEVQKAAGIFPIEVDESRIPGVFHLGYHSDKSFGATSYVITTRDANIIVDSPRYSAKLAAQVSVSLSSFQIAFM